MIATQTNIQTHDASTSSLSRKRLQNVCKSWIRLRSACAWTTRSTLSSLIRTSPEYCEMPYSGEKTGHWIAMNIQRSKTSAHEQRRHSSGGRDVDGEERRLYGA